MTVQLQSIHAFVCEYDTDKVLKAMFAWDKMDPHDHYDMRMLHNEIRVFAELQELQGSVIPQVYAAGVTSVRSCVHGLQQGDTLATCLCVP